jgi:Acetyltransferase (GNAT) domain
MDGMIYQDTIRWKGVPIRVDAVRAENKAFIISGRFIKTASLKNEWLEDIENPPEVVRILKASRAKIDLLKFWQRIPQRKAKYNYYKEWRQIAAIPIISYKHWFEKQISPKARNKIRKAQKSGIVVERIKLNDEFIRGVMAIYNQSSVRRGKPFWHYGKDFNTVKNELSADLERSVFVAAYYEKELIGFIRLLITDRYAMTLLILDKTAHRDKAPMNAMIAKVVEICAEEGIPYFTYTVWRRGEHGHFQESVGFEKIPVPEYFVPLTIKGELALRFRVHNGLNGALPEKVIVRLLALRSFWYSTKPPKMRRQFAGPRRGGNSLCDNVTSTYPAAAETYKRSIST